MIKIDEVVKQLDSRWVGMSEKDHEAVDLAIDSLKQKEWLINEYEHEVDTLEQAISESKSFPERAVWGTKLGVYRRVLADLKGDGEE